jgi:hypothetical protein
MRNRNWIGDCLKDAVSTAEKAIEELA